MSGTTLVRLWRAAQRLPEGLLRALATVAAFVAWAVRAGGVPQLEANLRRVRPQAGRREVRRLSRRGMRSYLRYYAEAFTVTRLTPDQVAARVRPVGTDELFAELSTGRTAVLALSHQGNWDLAGAWATVHLAPVTTVAERLDPPELFDEFVAMREGIGMRIIALEGSGGEVFRSLVSVVRRGEALVPLLADRDLTANGVEVELFGERARVAAGPAALHVATGAMVVPTTIYYERLTGARRRAAGSPWGIVIEFHPAPRAPEGMPRSEQVAYVTQQWVDALAAGIGRAPYDWHMLQKVFVADLDPERYAATVGHDGGDGRGAGEEGAP